MITQFHAHGITFFQDDRIYFENKLNEVKKFLGHHLGDIDSSKLDVKISKNRHHRGERFHGKAHLTAPHGGNFMAETKSKSIKALADNLKDILKRQTRKFNKQH